MYKMKKITVRCQHPCGFIDYIGSTIEANYSAQDVLQLAIDNEDVPEGTKLLSFTEKSL